MPLFLKQGDNFKVTSTKAFDLYEKLPVGTYTIGVDSCGSLFLQPIDDFAVKGKLYGDTIQNAKRILDTFLDRPASTGVLLAGEKGSGKTLLSKYIAQKAAELYEIPTIVINQNLHGESFNAFIQSITQPTVILFDEFEKVYHNPREQEAMLTLLDGVYPSKKLFLLTCNNKGRVDSNLRNRPGRIFYLLDFHGISQEFIAEYCQDNLNAKEHIPHVQAAGTLFHDAFNFDMLKALVEEMNRYGEPPAQALKFLNVRPEFSSDSSYKVALTVDGMLLKPKLNKVQPTWQGNPLTQSILLRYMDDNDSKEDDSHEPPFGRCKMIEFTMNHFVGSQGEKGRLVFYNEAKQARLVLSKAVTGVSFDFEKALQLTSQTMHHDDEKKAEEVEEDEDMDAFHAMENERGLMMRHGVHPGGF